MILNHCKSNPVFPDILRRTELLVCFLLTLFSVSNLRAQTLEKDTVNHPTVENAYIVVDKPALRLHVITGNDTLFSAPVCVGTNYGNKQRRGDRRTPEGTFYISMIQDSRNWSHNFRDGKGVVPHAYGPWFFRLKAGPWRAVGIHGTCFPESIGKRESEGCVRLNNDDLVKLRKLVSVGMKVVVLPDDAI